MKVRLSVIAGLLAASVVSVSATTFVENFTNNPAADGWRVFGDTNLFVWNAASNNLAVTWDSTRTNSYFHHPLGTIVTRGDDFSVAFDLNLSDIASGVEPGKTGPLEISFGFLNFAGATSTSFMRGGWGSAPNVAEFAYYTDGFYDFGDGFIWPAPAAGVPSFISGVDSFDYAPQHIAPYDCALPLNQTVHVTFTYTASSQTAVVTVTTNGVPVGSFPSLDLSSVEGFASTNDNFSLDTFSISSYSSFGDDNDSVLAHGTVANLVVTVPTPPVQNFSGSFEKDGSWKCQFLGQTNWIYALERSTDLANWSAVISGSAGTGQTTTFYDRNPPAACAYYRIRAERP